MLLEVKRTPDGKVLARRKDGRPLTPEDRQEARIIATALPSDEALAGKDYLSIEDVSRFLREAMAFLARIYLPGTIAWLKTERPELWEETLSLERALSQEGKALAQGRGNQPHFDHALSRYRHIWGEAIKLRKAQGNHEA